MHDLLLQRKTHPANEKQVQRSWSGTAVDLRHYLRPTTHNNGTKTALAFSRAT